MKIIKSFIRKRCFWLCFRI